MDVGLLFLALLIVAALFVLVRPNSQGPTLVNNVANGLSNLINAGTGGGGWNAR